MALIFALATLNLALIPAVSARPRASDVQVSGSFGYGGYFKVQTPAPLIFNISNSGEIVNGWAIANLESWVPPTYYNYPLAVPEGGSQRVEMGCYGCMIGNPCDVPLEIYTSDGALLRKESYESHLLGRYDTLIVHLGDPSSSLANLFNGDNPGLISMSKTGAVPELGSVNYPSKVFSVVLSGTDLPTNPLLCDGISLVATDISTWLALSDDVRNMLLGYVRHGGNLLVYYRDGVDPVDGWKSSALLPVSPSGIRTKVSFNEISQTCNNVFPKDYFNPISQRLASNYDRGIQGEFIRKPRPAEDNTSTAPSETVRTEPKSSWIHPDSYDVISVAPDAETENFKAGASTLLTVRSVGSGRAGFAAFDPFSGSPTSADVPIKLLAYYGLLDPFSPSTRTLSDTMGGLPSAIDNGGQIFFRQRIKSSETWFFRWMNAIGAPILIYLLGFPILAFISRGKGQRALALFIGWSLIMTTATMYRRNLPMADRAVINEANLFWCEALPPSNSEADNSGASRLSSIFSYTAETPSPRTISFQAPDGMIDEIADPTSWPYGTITIGEGQESRLPNLPLEPVMVGTERSVARIFTYRRPAPELTASGLLTITPTQAHLRLDAKLPSPAINGQIIVQSDNLKIYKDLGAVDAAIHLDVNLAEGTDEISRGNGLFSGSTDKSETTRFRATQIPESEDLSGALKSFRDLTISLPVTRGEEYSTSRITGRPGKAYILLASQSVPTKATADRGTIEQNAITITVISIPIIYEDSPI
jgi:hypothetical protein